MSSNDLGASRLSGSRGGRQRPISEMRHIQVEVPIEVEYAANFRDELDQYLKHFPDVTSEKVREHFTSSAKPIGLKDDVINNILDNRLAKRDAGLTARSRREERDIEGSKFFLLGIAGAATDTFVGFYTERMKKSLEQINTELIDLKQQLDENSGDQYEQEIGIPAEDVAPLRDRIRKLEAERDAIYIKSNKLGRELSLQNNDKFTKFIKEKVNPLMSELTSQTGMLFSSFHQKSTGKQKTVQWDVEPTPSSRPSAKL